MKRNYIILSFLSLISIGVKAQQDAMFSQYMDNQIYINPAFAGTKEQMNITMLHRQQWVGVKGAPMSTTFSVHTPLKYESVGLGLDVINDRLGPINRTSYSGNFAYRIKFANKGKLAFGLKGGLDSYSAQFTTIDAYQYDPGLQNFRNTIRLNFGAGIYYFAPKWFLGASIPRITGSKLTQAGLLEESKHIFAIAGIINRLNSNWSLRTSSQVRFASVGPMSLDVTLTGIYKEKLKFGGLYRLNDAAGLFFQMNITERFKFGYAYDFPLFGYTKGTAGTHEILLSFDFVNKQKHLTSPRYFN